MKIQIDTTAKTIKIGQNVKFSELIPALDALFPEDGWKEYELQTEHITQNINPVIVRPWWDNYNPFNVPYRPYVTYCGGTSVGFGSTVTTNSLMATTGTGRLSPSATTTFTLTNGVNTIDIRADEN